MSFIVLLGFQIKYADKKRGGRPKVDIEKSILPNIPLEDLFTELPLDIDRDIPLRWWSVKTAGKYLGVSERTLRTYIAEGKVVWKYKTVKGHRRILVDNRSVISLANTRKWKREQKETDDNVDQ